MPYTINKKGKRVSFSSARLGRRISHIYQQAHGDPVHPWREMIVAHVRRVDEMLRQQLGDHDQSLWPRPEITRVLEQELLSKADLHVQEAWFDLRRRRDTSDEPGDDPVWSIIRGDEAPIGNAPTTEPFREAPDPLHHLGKIDRPAPRATASLDASTGASTLRSHWVAFWKALAGPYLQPMQIRTWETELLGHCAAHQMNADSWMALWHDLIDQAMRKDIELHILAGLLERHCMLSRLHGVDWWAPVTGLANGEAWDGQIIDEDAYRKQWVAHMRAMAKTKRLRLDLKRHNLKSLSLLLDSRHDAHLSLPAWHRLTESGTLWPVERPGKDARNTVIVGCLEPLPWAWLRTAMCLAEQETDSASWTERFYRCLSERRAAVSESIVRECGTNKPVTDDRALMVKDTFEGVQDALYRAVVDTKWAGTVTLDWRQVRGVGSVVSGKRLSHGVGGFLKSASINLASQGRRDDDRPVTAIVPLWHIDALDLIHKPKALPNIQIVIDVPDAFFESLKNGGHWIFSDPHLFKSTVRLSPGTSIQPDETDLCKKHPNSWKRYRASSVYGWLIKACSGDNPPFLLFSDSHKPFISAASDHGTMAGTEGVGAFPVTDKNQTDIVWPAAAINMQRMIDDNGTLMQSALQDTADELIRLMDNALSTNGPMNTRCMCVGVIGFHEALSRATAHHPDPGITDQWVSGLAEAWSMAMAQADMKLTQERGACSDGWIFDPMRSVETLAAQRGEQTSVRVHARQDWAQLKQHALRLGGQRFRVRTVWAPFEGLALLTQVTPGGIGTLRSIVNLGAPGGKQRAFPSAFLLSIARDKTHRQEHWGSVLDNNPTENQPAILDELLDPGSHAWKVRLQHAAIIRAWSDQGVCVNVASDMPASQLAIFIKQAWWYGIPAIRFDRSERTLPEDQSAGLALPDEPGEQEYN